jgi:hypothetical protein
MHRASRSLSLSVDLCSTTAYRNEPARASSESLSLTVSHLAKPAIELARLRWTVAWRQAVRVQAEKSNAYARKGRNVTIRPRCPKVPARRAGPRNPVPTVRTPRIIHVTATDASGATHPATPQPRSQPLPPTVYRTPKPKQFGWGCHDHRRRRGVCGWGSRGGARQHGHDGNTSSYSFGDSDGAEWRTERGAN